jgi:hypothetical protein
MQLLQKNAAQTVLERIKDLLPEKTRSQPLKIRMGRTLLYSGRLVEETDLRQFREGRACMTLQILNQYIDTKPTSATINPVEPAQLSIELGATEIFRLSWHSQVEINLFWELHHQNPQSEAAASQLLSKTSQHTHQHSNSIGDITLLIERAYEIAFWMGDLYLKHEISGFLFQHGEYVIETTPTSVMIFKNNQIILSSLMHTRKLPWCVASQADIDSIQKLHVLAQSWRSYQML